MEKSCPKCGQSEHFHVVASAMFKVDDEGADQYGPLDWDDESWTRCPSCKWIGTWGDLFGTWEDLKEKS